MPRQKSASDRLWHGYTLVGAKRDTYQVNIKYEGKTRHVGRFKNEVDAAKAYDAAIVKYGLKRKRNFNDLDFNTSIKKVDGLKLTLSVFSTCDAVSLLATMR